MTDDLERPIPDAGDDTLLTVAEVHERLSVGISTVYHWIASGQLPAVRNGVRWSGTLGVRQSDLDAFFQRRKGDHSDTLDAGDIREHVAAESPQRLFARLISTAKGREILDANGIHGVERAEKAEAAVERVRAVLRELIDTPPPEDPEPCEVADEGYCHHDASKTTALRVLKELEPEATP